MFQRKSAKQTRELLEYLAGAQQKRQLESDHLAAQAAAADEKNRALDSKISKLENLLHGALAHDTYIDLEDLKTTPSIPDFDRTLPELRSYLPKAPSSLALLLPWKKKAYERQYEAAESRYQQERWEYDAALNEHQQQAGQLRAEADRHNEEIERYQRDFAAREPNAVAEYFALVLEKSAYPAGFPQESALAYLPESQQLAINYRLPPVDVIPAAKTYTYDKLRDEIIQTAMSGRRRRRLYSAALAQICLRTIYEVFTADQTNAIERIAFEGYVDAVDPGSGQPSRFCLVDLTITRQQFDGLNLEAVEPWRCLRGLNARLSSKPDQLLAVDLLAHDEKQEAAGAGGTDMLYYKERISELEGTIQTQSAQIREMESKLGEQRDRVAELAPELRDEQRRNAELNAEIQKQRSAIAELERRNAAEEEENVALEARPPDDLSDTQPTEAILEKPAENDFVEAGLFTPIGSETADDGARGARIPPREAGAEANLHLARKPNLLEVMSVFVHANGRYVDYIVGGLPKEQVDRLIREGKLERHRLDAQKFRATLAGNRWYRERSNPRAALESAFARPTPPVEYDAQKTISLGELLRDQTDSPVAAADGGPDKPARTDNRAAGLSQQTAATSDDLLTDLNELVSCINRLGEAETKLLSLLKKSNWECSQQSVQAAFRERPFIRPIIHNINDPIYEVIGENLIEEEDDKFVIDKEYRDALEQALTLTDNQYLMSERGRR